MSTRLSVNINDDTARTLRTLADADEATVTEIVRRAVAVYGHVREAHDAGRTIELTPRPGHGERDRERLVLL